jgi:hypothetical protein
LVSAPLLVQYFCTHRNCIQQTSISFHWSVFTMNTNCRLIYKSMYVYK